MRIAISSTGKTLESEIDSRFGRCSYFLIVNIENNEIKDFNSIENTAKEQSGGAGISAGKLVSEQNVDAVIANNVGPRAFSVFEQFNIKIYSGEGKIKDALQQFIKGELKELKDSNSPQHTGLKP